MEWRTTNWIEKKRVSSLVIFLFQKLPTETKQQAVINMMNVFGSNRAEPNSHTHTSYIVRDSPHCRDAG